MMPSRGLQAVVRAKAPRLLHAPSRNLTTASRFSLRIQASSLVRSTQPWSKLNAAALPSMVAIRYASTAPSSSSTPLPSSTAPPTETTAFPDLDTITLDNIGAGSSAVDISSIPEGIGYLKEIGIDYGFGPTAILRSVLEHAHISAGLPWWASIVLTAISVRMVLFPLFLRSSDAGARQSALNSVTKPIMDRMNAAKKVNDTQGMMLAYQQLGAIRKRAGISMGAMLLPSVGQGVLGFCGYRLTHACATLPVPGFYNGGLLWLQDLTITDGWLALPAIMAVFIHLVVRMGGESGTAAFAQVGSGFKNFMYWGMPTIIFAVTAFQPVAVALWFASTGLLGIIQAKLLQQPAVRSFFKLAPIYKPKPGESTGSLMEVLQTQAKTAEAKAKDAKAALAKAPNVAYEEDSKGKNARFMAPTYQSPNLNRSRSPITINAKLAKRPSAPSASAAADMVQPGSSSKDDKRVLSSATRSRIEFRRSLRERVER